MQRIGTLLRVSAKMFWGRLNVAEASHNTILGNGAVGLRQIDIGLIGSICPISACRLALIIWKYRFAMMNEACKFQ